MNTPLPAWLAPTAWPGPGHAFVSQQQLCCLVGHNLLTVLSSVSTTLVMEFSSNQEDIYSKLVNKSKYGKAVQVKYELTRPRKKQKKKNEAKLEIVQEPNSDTEDVYCVPPDERIDDDDDESDDDESLDPPAPPPRSDSLLPEPDNTAAAVVTNPSCDPAPPPAAAVVSESSASNPNPSVNIDVDNIYAPCNWRQQNYESWTPFFNPSVKDNIPPPSQVVAFTM